MLSGNQSAKIIKKLKKDLLVAFEIAVFSEYLFGGLDIENMRNLY